MRISFTILNRKYYFGTHRMTEVNGVNSNLPDGKHFLMWDFDDNDLKEVTRELIIVQAKYNLSAITILNTGRENSYHAYCFSTFDLDTVKRIIMDTRGVCWTFLMMAHRRGYFTLRFSPKAGREIKKVAVLSGYADPDINPLEVSSLVRYSTKAVHE